MPGIITSQTTTSGRSSRADVRPCGPSVASRTVWPAFFSAKAATTRWAWSSSINRTFAIANSRKKQPAQAAYLGRKKSAGSSPALFMGPTMSVLAPHLAGGIDHQAQLAALVFHGDVVAVHRAGEAALGRQRQLVHGRVLGRFV